MKTDNWREITKWCKKFRKAVREMMCMQCLKVQHVNPTCTNPSCNQFSMAKYYCNTCKLFDDERWIFWNINHLSWVNFTDMFYDIKIWRAVYHCPFCNLCRLGKGLGIDFFHCMKCNCCLGLKLVNHKCRENMLETNCPICYDFLFTSSAAIKALPCGHFMHSTCFQVSLSLMIWYKLSCCRFWVSSWLGSQVNLGC